MEKLGVLKGTGVPLAVVRIGKDHFAGPQEYIESELFGNSSKFKASFKVLRTISRTIFTSGRVYRVKQTEDNLKVLALLPQSTVDNNLLSVIETGENAVEWQTDLIRNLISVEKIHKDLNLDCPRECALIEGTQKIMFEKPQKIYLIEEKRFFMEDDPDYSIHYYELPEGLANKLLGGEESSGNDKRSSTRLQTRPRGPFHA